LNFEDDALRASMSIGMLSFWDKSYGTTDPLDVCIIYGLLLRVPYSNYIFSKPYCKNKEKNVQYYKVNCSHWKRMFVSPPHDTPWDGIKKNKSILIYLYIHSNQTCLKIKIKINVSFKDKRSASMIVESPCIYA